MKIVLDRVSFSYGHNTVLRDVSASVALGEFVCLLGANGAGKSTMFGLMAGELEPTRGRVVVEDARSNDLANRDRHIAHLPQDLQDPPYVTVRELVSLGRFKPERSLGWRLSDEDRDVVSDCIFKCDAKSLADRPFGQLSGGEKQRAWLAFCLAQEREFLLLDESLHGIDYFTRRSFFEMLSNLASEGRGVVLTTHDPDMALRHAHRVLVLRDGELAYDGPPDQKVFDFIDPLIVR